MANCKDVQISARVPFDWTSNLTDHEARVWCAWVLSPSTGLVLDQRSDGQEPNEHGGITAMYYLNLTGVEAIGEGALAVLADSLRKQEMARVDALACDVENDTAYSPILTVAGYDEMRERVQQRYVHTVLNRGSRMNG